MCRKCHVSGSNEHLDRWNTYGKIIKFTDRFPTAGCGDREDLWGHVDGIDILEVGVGPGRSMAHYPEGANVTAVDISEPMLDMAADRAESNGIDVDLRQVDAEQMPFEDGRFDCVVTNATLCCTQNIRPAIREIRRVLSADGQTVMLENVRADTDWVATLQDKLKPVYGLLRGGYFHRDTPAILEESGFTLDFVESKDRFGTSKLIVASPVGQ